eukprot:7381822-Prymnesium_polylepis.2
MRISLCGGFELGGAARLLDVGVERLPVAPQVRLQAELAASLPAEHDALLRAPVEEALQQHTHVRRL